MTPSWDIKWCFICSEDNVLFSCWRNIQQSISIEHPVWPLASSFTIEELRLGEEKSGNFQFVCLLGCGDGYVVLYWPQIISYAGLVTQNPRLAFIRTQKQKHQAFIKAFMISSSFQFTGIMTTGQAFYIFLLKSFFYDPWLDTSAHIWIGDMWIWIRNTAGQSKPQPRTSFESKSETKQNLLHSLQTNCTILCVQNFLRN